MQVEQREAIFGLKLNVCQQQVVAHGHPNLREYGILGRAEKSFKLQVLLDPAEEGFDLPTGLIDRGDGGSGQG